MGHEICICSHSRKEHSQGDKSLDLSHSSTAKSPPLLKIRSNIFSLSIQGNKSLTAEKMLELNTKLKGTFPGLNETILSKTKISYYSTLNNERDWSQSVLPQYSLTFNEEAKIKEALDNHFLFVEISEVITKLLISHLQLFKFNKGMIIYREGQEGNYIFLLYTGQLEVKSNGKVVKCYQDCRIFGEIELISQTNREETVTCLTDAEIFCLDGLIFKEILHKIADEKYKDRFNFLNSIPFFNEMDSIVKYNLCEKIRVVLFFPGNKIITQGEEGNGMYLIKEGSVSCEINGERVRKLKSNDYFGHNAVLIDAKRAMDVIALKRTVCYQLTIDDLKNVFGNGYRDIILFSFFKSVTEKHSFFNEHIIDSVFQLLYQSFTLHTYKENESITRDGTDNKKIMLILEGGIFDTKADRFEGERGSIYGDFLLRDNSAIIEEGLIARPDLICLEAPIDKVSNRLGIYGQEKKVNSVKRMRILERSFLFRNMSKKSIEAIAGSLKKMKYFQGDVILKEKTQGDYLYLIIKGKVRVSKDGSSLRDLEAGNCFGEIALLDKAEDIRTATVTALDKVVLFAITKQDFDLIISDPSTKEILLKKISLHDTNISIKDLFLIKFLGKGKFGNVYLVHNNKNVYSIKVISRQVGNQQKIFGQSFLNERKVMLTLDHPFIIKMIKTMKSSLYCFFLIEYINGLNLSDYILHRENIKDIDETRFYAASMLIVIDYLQKKYIAHRDIKPNNIMIDVNGYIKLIDFGTAKYLKDYTSTLIGTPHYIAPEILLGKGYARSCDFWSVGVCIYEIFYGEFPFGNKACEVVEIYKEIIHRELSFPSFKSKYDVVNQLICLLLKKKVAHRICNLCLLKAAEFFQGFDWDRLIDFQLKAPFIPKAFDLSNFQYIYTEPFEEALKNCPINQYELTAFDANGDESPLVDTRWADDF